MEEKENVNVSEEVKNEKVNKKEDKKKINKEIEKLQEEKNGLNDKLLRVMAEMQNMKRRYEEEISKIYKYDGEELIKKILNILDNFERAIAMDNDNKEDEVTKFLNGFQLIYNDLKKIIVDAGVVEIECLEQPFDPEKMEAMMTEHIEGKDGGIVTCVLQKGYIYKDKVIRPAMVKVNE